MLESLELCDAAEEWCVRVANAGGQRSATESRMAAFARERIKLGTFRRTRIVERDLNAV